MMWQRSVPSNPTTPTHQHNSRVGGFPSDPPGLLVEETLECQEEYPREMAEEAEEEAFLRWYRHNKHLPMEETNLSATRHSYSQGIAQNRRRS